MNLPKLQKRVARKDKDSDWNYLSAAWEVVDAPGLLLRKIYISGQVRSYRGWNSSTSNPGPYAWVFNLSSGLASYTPHNDKQEKLASFEIVELGDTVDAPQALQLWPALRGKCFPTRLDALQALEVVMLMEEARP